MASKEPKKPRLSLTKEQLQSGIGAELYALCQSVTADGVLSKEQIIALRNWIKDRRSSDLPAIRFLTETLVRILADGKVTKEERTELYKAIEKILPVEARRQITDNRKSVEAEEKARVKAARNLEKQHEREEGEKNRRICSPNFMVAGVHYEGRPEIINRYVEEGNQVFLIRDRQNRFSQYAVEILLSNGLQIGFVPDDFADEIAPLLDQGCGHHAFVTKILTGGRVPIPVVQAYVYGPQSNVAEVVFESQVPAKRFNDDGIADEDLVPLVRANVQTKGSGCLSLICFGLLLAACVASTFLAI
jgi:hypothetical protein